MGVEMSKKVLDIKTRTPSGRHAFTILESAVHVEEANIKSDVFELGDWEWLQIVLDVTDLNADSGDKLDIIIEMSTTEAFTVAFNVAQFTSMAGDEAAQREVIWLIPQVQNVNPDAIFVAADAATVVSQCQFGRYLRASTTVTRATGTDDAFTFSLKAYVK
jgi:hypothetical protein